MADQTTIAGPPAGDQPTNGPLPLDRSAIGHLTLETALRLLTGTTDGGLPPVKAIEMAACMVGASFSDAIAMMAQAGAQDPVAAARHIDKLMVEVLARIRSGQLEAAEKQAIALANAMGLTASH